MFKWQYMRLDLNLDLTLKWETLNITKSVTLFQWKKKKKKKNYPRGSISTWNSSNGGAIDISTIYEGLHYVVVHYTKTKWILGSQEGLNISLKYIFKNWLCGKSFLGEC